MTTGLVAHWPHTDGALPPDEMDGGNSSSRLFERSRIRALAEEREKVQKKTFTKWVNSHLRLVSARVQDLYTDLRDGRNLLKLLEILSGERLPKPTPGRMRIHCLENVDKALQFLKDQQVHVENLGSHDIVDGNPRLTLGLIWTIILRFQIQEIVIQELESSETRSAKDALLLWCQMKTADYGNVNIKNFTTSWRDGLAFNALIHKHRPDLMEYDKLNKMNSNYNLENSFTVAERDLGITRLLDVEDVNVEYPDEKSIITYVVAYYHYFSKMKLDTVQGRRIGKVIDSVRECEAQGQDYDRQASDLLKWIRDTIDKLNDRKFTNSLVGVQRQLAEFNSYRTMEKPPRFGQKGDLELRLFELNSKLRAQQMKLFLPREGRTLAEVNVAWEQLEKAEHERELALREEVLRQEKLRKVAEHFDKKAGMRESWISENQRLVSQDNFGTDLASIEASAKKHEAIETDIFAYEERVQAVVNDQRYLESENYHDIDRITARKDNVLRLWNYLLEILRGRRERLERTRLLYQTFDDMIQLLQQMEEVRTKLDSDEYGRHLMDVEDLLQKHALLENDIAGLGDRIRARNAVAKEFADAQAQAQQPALEDAALINERVANLETTYAELMDLAQERRARLEESRRIWQFLWDIAEEEAWIKEKDQILLSSDIGRDLSSINVLINKHKSLEDDLSARRSHLMEIVQQGEQMIADGHFGAEQIQQRINDINTMWENLMEHAALRKQRLLDAVEYHQFFVDAHDVDSWMHDTLRVITSTDYGRDDASVQSLLRKHQDVMDNLHAQREASLVALDKQANELGEQDRNSEQVRARLDEINERYDELQRLSELRKQRLLDALRLYKLAADADNVEQWAQEKERLLRTLTPTHDMEELEVMKHRFEGFRAEMEAQQTRLQAVNEEARQLLEGEHPNSEEIVQRQNRLNQLWSRLQSEAKVKEDELHKNRYYQTFRVECQETTRWIEEKIKLMEETVDLGNDLGGLIKLQRRLSFVERDMEAIQAKLDSLEDEAKRIEHERPQESREIRSRISQIQQAWTALNNLIKEQDAKLEEAGDLQRFLRDLDAFQSWLSRHQRDVASQDVPDNMADAEKLLARHQQIREEMDRFEQEYHTLMDMGQQVTRSQTDPQYILLRERLSALSEGWENLQRMWDNRQRLLTESLAYQIFLRDARQAEVLLTQQETYLARFEPPRTLEDAETLLKRHDTFITTMGVNDEKINQVLSSAERLTTQEGNFAADKIHKKAENIAERSANNRERAKLQLERLHDHHRLQQFLRDCEEMREFVQDKMVAAEDETYRAARTAHQKWTRHQAFEAELAANKPRLESLVREGEELAGEKPEFREEIMSPVRDLTGDWQRLEDITRDKGEKLFDANRQAIYEQTVDDIDNWVTELQTEIETRETGEDLTSVNILIQKQQAIENQLRVKAAQVEELAPQAEKLRELVPEQAEQITTKRINIEERFRRLQEPLQRRKEEIEKKKRALQFVRDVEDERDWIEERMKTAASGYTGQNLHEVMRLQNKARAMRGEIENHQHRLNDLNSEGELLIQSTEYTAEMREETTYRQQLLAQLNDEWQQLLAAMDARDAALAASEAAQQYLYDANEAESWMSEQELYLLNRERPKDAQMADVLLAKHSAREQVIEDFASTVRELADRAAKLQAQNNPMSETIALRQAQLEKTYAGLRDLAGDRRQHVEGEVTLFTLQNDINDLEQWIQEKEVVASSQEVGNDFDQCHHIRERFRRFVEDTLTTGTDRIRRANEHADQLIAVRHPDAAIIAQWKDRINESWENLKEIMDTRRQLLDAAHELFRFFHDCRELLSRIVEKQNSMSEDLGRDTSGVSALQRKHSNFRQDLAALSAQVEDIQQRSGGLLTAYAGERAREIQMREAEVVNAWRQLHGMVDMRARKLNATSDLFRFFAMARDLMLWMDDLIRQMNQSEKPRDVSGVELLMNNHQGLKAEIDARETSFNECVALGQQLMSAQHYASRDIEDKLFDLGDLKKRMADRWEERWERLQLILEVYQFYREAAAAETWLITQEPYLLSQELGRSVEEVEGLIKKHQAFERAVTAQEERFQLLARPTTFELKEMAKRRQLERGESERERRRPSSGASSSRARQTQRGGGGGASEMGGGGGGAVVSERGGESGGGVGTVRGGEERIGGGGVASSSRAFSPGESTTLEQSQLEGAGASAAAAAAAAARTTSPVQEYPDDVVIAGSLNRKHLQKAGGQKATERSWTQVFAVVRQTRLYSYRDEKTFRTHPERVIHHEQPIELSGAEIRTVQHHSKGFVLQVLIPDNGGSFMFQARTEAETEQWVQILTSVATGAYSSGSAGVGGGGGGGGQYATSPESPTSPTTEFERSAAARESGASSKSGGRKSKGLFK